MDRFLLLPCCFLLFLCPAFGDAPWVSVPVPSAEEAAAIGRLESGGVPVLGWSNAVVEISVFEGLQTIPLSTLSARLTPQDPRWDPWLRSALDRFRPQSGVTPLWVPSGQVSQALTLLGSPDFQGLRPTKASEITPPLVTGWTLVSLTLLYVVLAVYAGFRFGWPSRKEPRRWLWVPLSLALLAGGSLLAAGAPAGRPGTPAVSPVSWYQHRWFQEVWPWGGRWDHYAPGKVWTFPSYEHRDGKLAEVSTALNAGDSAWVRAVWEGLDPRHAARIFGTPNP